MKLLERPINLAMAADISNIKFRLVMDLHGQPRQDSKDELQDLYGDQMYTFNGDNNIEHTQGDHSAKSRTNNQTKRSANLDLVAENCKLESIIEQYRLTNDRLKHQVIETQENNSKADLLIETINGFFLDVSRRGHSEKLNEHSEQTNQEFVKLASKISEAIEGKECNFLKETLKEFSGLLESYRSKSIQLERENQSLITKLESLKKNQDLLEYEMKDIMKTAQDICNTENDKPVNIYQMKVDLRRRLKSMDRNQEVKFP